MIDTDKYTGHTEGPWKAFEDIEGNGYKTGAWTVGNAVHKSTAPPLHFTDEHDPHTYNVMGICLFQPNRQNNEADAKLIADAPLLLAEVKRLRKEINQLPIDLHESLDMILEAHYPEVRESVMAMFGDAWGNNLTGYEE